MKKIFALFIIVIYSTSVFAQKTKGELRVSPNGHYLEYEDGTPFFWLGDTGWDLFLQLNLKQIKTYLDNRAAKGFNVIQAVVVTERSLRASNSYGALPLKNEDPTQPNEQYFKLIDTTIQLAADRNMYIGLLPTWGDKVSKMWGKGPVIFDSVNAYTYGKWLGNRYKNDWNIIWIIGGDRPAYMDSMDWRPVWRAMARGIRDGSNKKVLITYHPSGESSSTQFWSNDSSTLDFNMLQSGHRVRDLPVWEWIRRDYNLKPAKPILDGEPNYEDHPVNWDPKNGYFRAYDVRKQSYRSVFSGACGVTYGNNSIFFFYGPGDKNINSAERYWYEALDRPGAFQAGYLKKLILSRPSLNRIPDQSIIITGQEKDNAHYMTAFRDADSTYAMIYMPVGQKVKINTACVKGKKIKAWWFDPGTGKIAKSFTFKAGIRNSFTPPRVGAENDWVLVLDDTAQKYKKP